MQNRGNKEKIKEGRETIKVQISGKFDKFPN